ncbi:MAG: hypothetical protein KIT31_19800 [Deltaproteobacteria bacterium]|nr:hypothetical protein [Deltaproteobacteria bacterium]
MRITAVPLLLATGCLVTQAPQLGQRPRWRAVGTQAIETSCALGRAFVRKSGKQGVGITLVWKSRRDCRISVDTVHVAFDGGGGRIAVPVAPATPLELPGRSLRYAWLPVAFDNNRAWNDEHNTAAVELAVTSTAPGEPAHQATWRISMEQK